jgi:murein DD-endopeptidase MepM/ murein hydrolase activator NlpD
MAKQKFYFNPDHLSLTPSRRSLKKRITAIAAFVILCLALGTMGYYLTAGLISTPREKILLSQHEKLVNLYQSLNQKLDKYEDALAEIRIMDDSIYRSLIGQPPLPASIRNAGTGGHEPGSNLRDAAYPELVTSTAQKIDQLDSHLKVQMNSFRSVLSEMFHNKDRLEHLPAIMPISNEDLRSTGSGFGMRLHPILNIYRMHEGIDFHAPVGTEVFATADGRVKDVRISETFGKVIVIDHGYGLETFYAHLNGYDVRKGQKVKRGNRIGFVGNTGLSKGPHLHYEVHIFNREVDPVNYFFKDLTPEEYRKIVLISQSFKESMD